MLSKDLTYQEAMDLFYKQTSYIIDAFESILDLINEINRKILVEKSMTSLKKGKNVQKCLIK